MSEKLKDPSKAAHEIIEVLEDGDAIRNDGVRLTAANKNPWYVLATIYDEQPEGSHTWENDEELTFKNRRAWNGWFCAELSAEERADRAEKTRLDVSELMPLSTAELTGITKRFRARLKDKTAELPARTESINFSQVYFTRFISLAKFVLEKTGDFSSATFTDGAYFHFATFLGGARFHYATFTGDAFFRSATFTGEARFRYATFMDSTDFSSATFTGEADIRSATFTGGTRFHYATFTGKADFRSATFTAGAYFGSATFTGDADFSSATFTSDAGFSSTKFKSTTRFTDAIFLTHVPEFHAAELYDDTVFAAGEKDLANWPRLKGEGVMPAPDQKRAYNRLRLFMNKSLQIDEEQFFHRQEMRCKAVLAKWYHKPLYWLFAAFSDYGNSVWRPIAWGALSVVAAALFMLWWQGVFAFTPQNDAGFDWTLGLLEDGDVWAKPREAFGWSISNALPFIGTGNLYFGGDFANELAWPLRVIGGVQTLFGFVLLFLFGLGLRNRFRLR